MKNHLSFYYRMTKLNSTFIFICIALFLLLILIYLYPTTEGMRMKVYKKKKIIQKPYQPPPSVQYIPEELITWKPYVLDIYNQPAYHAYFYDNHYMYPLA